MKFDMRVKKKNKKTCYLTMKFSNYEFDKM